jgi:xylitol oxidase
MTANRLNWAGNHTYAAARLHCPETLDELRRLVAESQKLKVLGTRHSFNDIADTKGDQISLEKFDRILGIDAAQNTVTIEAGVRYGTLGKYLHDGGYALPNLASLPHISVAGACATATHGSGDANGNLSTAVAALELLTAEGQRLALSREAQGPEFDGMVVALGALGIVTKLTLKIVPAFQIRQIVYENLPFAQLANHFEQIMSSAYSVSLFTDWQNDRISQIWLKQRVTPEAMPAIAPTFFDATLAPVDRHPITSVSPENCTTQRGQPGPWHERLPHFRLEYTPSCGQELQSEYFVPRQHAAKALQGIAQLHRQVSPHLMISEIRTIAADTLWLSPCRDQPRVGIHFTWKPNWPAVQQILPIIESRLAPFNARPHWAKLFTMNPARLASLYPRLPDFQRLAHKYDPSGKFRNDFLNRYVFATTSS